MPDERADALQGSAKVVQKGPSDCNNLGPVTAGFNQAACGMFYKCMCLDVCPHKLANVHITSVCLYQTPSMDSGVLTLEIVQSWHFVFKTRLRK